MFILPVRSFISPWAAAGCGLNLLKAPAVNIDKKELIVLAVIAITCCHLGIVKYSNEVMAVTKTCVETFTAVIIETRVARFFSVQT
jgi:hypothetical protein